MFIYAVKLTRDSLLELLLVVRETADFGFLEIHLLKLH